MIKFKKNTVKKRSITQRWITNNLAVVVLIMISIMLAFVYAIQTFYYASARQTLTGELTSIVNLLNRYAQDSETNLSSEMRSTFESFSAKDKMELMAVNSKGRVVLTSSGFSPSAGTTIPDYENLLSGGDGYWVGKAENQEKIMAVCADISSFSSEYHAVRVVCSLTEIDRAVGTVIIGATIVCSMILLMLVLTGIYFVGSIIKPIAQVSNMAGKFAKGDFSSRIRYEDSDEIGDLCKAINHMADELSTAEEMKNEFISSVSHELRTPLTAIKGWAETISYADNDPETVRKGMNVIVNETARLSQMVEELLDFSRMQSGHFTLQKATMDVLAELGDAVLIYMNKKVQDNIRIEYDEPEMLPFVYGDKNRIRQVFINIIDNAVKYSDPGGHVRIKAFEQNGNVCVSVSDDGCGIKASDLPKIKTKFYKPNHTRRGSGIGLAVADEIISEHGGSIDITSEEGVGTTVLITLPPESHEI
ncbi:MAG: HAMP domain-containing histidine kinase [Oscillospiraceae bacterium]|nr:HAMP domain-containing histidine kinase [Oscillospiraceae bacterium]